VQRVAERLDNTPAIRRKAYIHPAVMAGYLRGQLVRVARNKPPAVPTAVERLSAEEQALLSFLEQKQVSLEHLYFSRREISRNNKGTRSSVRRWRNPQERQHGQVQ
jgi:hypothetical protein